MNTVRILVADSHDVVRRSVRAALEGELAWDVCAEAASGMETLAKTLELMPDVVVLDVGLPGLNGVEVTREIARAAPAVHVLVLTMDASPQLARHLSEAGARGYIPKAEVGRTLVDAIRAAIGQETDFGNPQYTVADDQTAGSRAGPAGTRIEAVLTSREREVLQLLAEGRSNKEVGIMLAISAKTVETHRARIRDKLRLRSMGELVRYAIRHQIINA